MCKHAYASPSDWDGLILCKRCNQRLPHDAFTSKWWNRTTDYCIKCMEEVSRAWGLNG